MTRDEYETWLRGLSPRKLDAEVAEKVMGWHWVDWEDFSAPGAWIDNKNRLIANVWQPSEQISAAWEVVDKITDPKKMTQAMFDNMANSRFGYWWESANLWARTAAEAAREICLAACLAVWKEQP